MLVTADQKMLPFLLLLFLIFNSLFYAEARIHHLNLEDDSRQHFKISSFGYLFGGSLRVNMSSFSYDPPDQSSKFGFSILKTKNDALHPFSKQRDFCILESDVPRKWFYDNDNIGLVTITLDFQREEVIVKCNPYMKMFELRDGYRNYPAHRVRRNDTNQVPNSSDKLTILPVAKLFNILTNPNASNHQNAVNITKTNAKSTKVTNRFGSRQSMVTTKSEESVLKDKESQDSRILVNPTIDESEEKGDEDQEKKTEADDVCRSDSKISLTRNQNSDGIQIYSFSFHASILDDSLEGLYSIYFHNCPNYKRNMVRSYQLVRVNLSMIIEEKNFESYLSAGEIPLPQLYFTLSLVFFILSFIWLQILRNRKEDTFKIHILMGVLVFIKALALFFHSINNHFISQEGYQIETWAVLYYVTHFLKGALLFITIALIGTGWAFIKHILSDKDKKMFMIVIPLQVLANVAEIITEESEEGQLMHNVWRSVFILVDLICCGAILFPIIWSIRHLQEASHIDGKAAINLQKLKLFRRFYVIIVCYIYFTRIIVYILRVMVPFQYEWLDIFFQNAATLLFFIFTGYHFQPTHSNPYFQLSQKDLEMEEILFNVTPNIYVASSMKKRTRDKTGDDSQDRQALISDKEENLDFE